MSKKDSSVYLADIKDAIEKIEDYVRDGKTVFFKDGKTQDAVIRQIAIIGEAAKKVPKSLKDKAPGIPWKDIAGMRDIVIHDYSMTDLPMVWNTVVQDLPELKFATERLLKEIAL